MAEIFILGPHDRMTPEQALAAASQEAWKHIIICGFQPDSENIVVRSSHVSRELALWIAEHLKLHITGQI